MKLSALRVLSCALLLGLGMQATVSQAQSSFGGAESAPVVASAFFRTSDGLSLHYYQAGPQHSASTVLLLPGWSMPASLWNAQWKALAVRHRVLALDPRGQGLSEFPAPLDEPLWSIDRRADDVRELLRSLDRASTSRLILVGWSLGALELLHALQREPALAARVAAVVLVDSSVGEGEPGAASGFRAALQADRRAALESFIRAIFVQPQSENRINELLQGALRLPLQTSLDLFPTDVPREYWRNAARSLAMPLLYVVTPQFAQQAALLEAARMQAGRPVQTAVFESAGHALFVDQAEPFNNLLEEFLLTLD